MSKNKPRSSTKWFFVTWYGSIGGHKSTKSLSGKRLNWLVRSRSKTIDKNCQMSFYIRVTSIITPVHCITQTEEPWFPDFSTVYNARTWWSRERNLSGIPANYSHFWVDIKSHLKSVVLSLSGGPVNFFFGNSGSTIDHSSFVILLEYILAYSKVSIFGDD